MLLALAAGSSVTAFCFFFSELIKIDAAEMLWFKNFMYLWCSLIMACAIWMVTMFVRNFLKYLDREDP